MILDAIILGIIQGLTEFLPVSSSGHLVIAEWVLSWKSGLMNSLAFDVALHAGTLVAVLWYFRRDWLRFGEAVLKVLRGSAPGQEARLVAFIALATLPAVIIGVLYEKAVENVFRDPLLVAAALVAGSFIMWFADRSSPKDRPLSSMTLGHALLVGVAQAVALIPGVSRSGITISAALAAGYRRADAARFSFLLSTPIIAGAAFYKLRHFSAEGSAAWACFLGTLSAAVVGYLAIRFLISYLERHSLDLFVWYRLALAGAVGLLWLLR